MSKFLKINWSSGPTQVPIKETFLAAIGSLQQQITNITAVQIRNKSEVINSTEADVQTTATNYIKTNYDRDPQNWDGLIITITDKNNDKILYIYSEASNLWINSGINDVDLSNYYTKDQVYNKDEIDTKVNILTTGLNAVDTGLNRVSDKLGNEVVDRQAADTTLQENIDKEQARAQTAEQANEALINKEIDDRKAAISTLNGQTISFDIYSDKNTFETVTVLIPAKETV